MKMNLAEVKKQLEEDFIPTGNKPRNITAEWTGCFPCLCFGEWIIRIDGQPVELPEDVRTSPMHTYGSYDSWSFNDDWSEQWDSYEDGLTFKPWLAENERWVSELGLSSEEEHDLFDAISAVDWRHGSCGGCI